MRNVLYNPTEYITEKQPSTLNPVLHKLSKSRKEYTGYVFATQMLLFMTFQNVRTDFVS